MADDDADADAAAPTPQSKPRGLRPLTSPREELLNGPKHGGQAMGIGVGLPAPVSDIPDAPPSLAEGTAVEGAGRQGEHRADDEES